MKKTNTDNYPPTLNAIIEDRIRRFWNQDALTDYTIFTYQYKDVARLIEKLHILFEAAGIQPGDKIALCGRNTARWAVAFFATLTYKAVAVPILHEFHPHEVHDLVNHSEAKLLFVGDQVWSKLDAEAMPALCGIISNADYSLLVSRDDRLTQARENLNLLFGQRFPSRFTPDDVHYAPEDPEQLAVLNYTSGTTSNSKGVMLPYRALHSNYLFAEEVMGANLTLGGHVLSILPMAHMYGMAFEFVFEFLHGSHIYYLTRTPSPAILMKAFADIRPELIVSVPLIIEKIVRKSVLPKLETPGIKVALKIPYLRDRLKEQICEKLREAFGGKFYEIIIGGAAFSQDVEAVLKDINFPFTVGYGATECAPIICYSDWHDTRLGSCGTAAPRMEVRIDSPDPANQAGEILCRGANVMLGYYHNDEATTKALDADGWFHTGDLGVMDADGYVYIKGRSKNMLLGASGQNIYPEDIEDKLSSLPYVTECVVIQRDQQLYGLVYSDPAELRAAHISDADLVKQMELNRQQLNTMVPSYARLHAIRLVSEEFEKTPKKSIRRYKYMNYPV